MDAGGIVSTYPDLLAAEALRKRCCNITRRRIRYFRLFAGHPYHLPAANRPRHGGSPCGAGFSQPAGWPSSFSHEGVDSL